MKLILFLNVLTFLYYLLLVFIFNGQKFIFPIFVISIYALIFFIKRKEFFHSLYLLIFFLVISLFLPNTNISVTIIYLVFLPLTLFLGYYISSKVWVVKLIYPVLVILIGIYGFSNFWFFVNNFNARQVIKAPKSVLYTESEQAIRLDTVKNKVIVLDFWTTNCGLCFKGFPEIEKLHLKYKDDDRVEIYTLNIPIKRDTVGYAISKLAKYNYTFNKLYAKSDSIPKAFNFNGYPRLMLIKNGEVRFNGYPNTDKNVFLNDLSSEVELLLNEDKN